MKNFHSRTAVIIVDCNDDIYTVSSTVLCFTWIFFHIYLYGIPFQCQDWPMYVQVHRMIMVSFQGTM